METRDKAGQAYWDQLWEGQPLPRAVDPSQSGLRHYIKRRFHEYFCRLFADMNTRGKSLLELGCARSVWLPYFAKEFGLRVAGLDYSEKGCAQTRALLAAEGVEGRVVCADFFSPPGDMCEAYDVVFSFGLAEHFQNTSECIAAFARFLRPGGLIITTIPNMVGAIGFVQKLVNRPVFDIHVPLNHEDLVAAHVAAGLNIRTSGYFLPTHFGVNNLSGLPQSASWFLKKMILSGLIGFSVSVWALERIVGPLPPSRLLSPYIHCVAEKPK